MDKGLEVIRDKISENARKKAESLIAAAEKNADQSKKNAEAEYERIIEAAKKEAEKNREIARMRSESLAEANKRRADSDLRQKLIAEVTQKALDILAGKSLEEKVALYSRLIKQSGVKEGEITLAKSDAEVAKPLLKELGSKFKDGGVTDKIKGGLIVQNGDIAQNLSYDLAVRICRRDIEKAAADILYAKDKH